MCDGAIIAIINIFGISYSTLFVLQFLFFHFPLSPEMIMSSLFLIFFTTVSSMVLLFPMLLSVQLGYLFSFTLATIGNLVDFLAQDFATSISPLAVQFGWSVILNALSVAIYLLRPLEKLCMFGGWRFELYVMHSILTYSIVLYSQAVLCAMLESAQ
ncbi:unnamed protein product [Penicillium salamii]|nr:unnamed protein product [Penicillium salamii]